MASSRKRERWGEERGEGCSKTAFTRGGNSSAAMMKKEKRG